MEAVVENPGQSHSWIAKQFGIDNSTVSRVVQSFKETQTTQRRQQTKSKDDEVRDYSKRNPNLSMWDVAKKVNSFVGFIQQTMNRDGLHAFEVRKPPYRTDKQNTVAKSRARKLHREGLVQPKCIVMNDEDYIIADAKQNPGLKFFVGKSRLDVPEKFRKKKVDKFAKKYGVWQAICGCGKFSKPYITTGTINGQLYKKIMPPKAPAVLPSFSRRGHSVFPGSGIYEILGDYEEPAPENREALQQRQGFVERVDESM